MLLSLLHCLPVSLYLLQLQNAFQHVLPGICLTFLLISGWGLILKVVEVDAIEGIECEIVVEGIEVFEAQVVVKLVHKFQRRLLLHDAQQLQCEREVLNEHNVC